MYGTNLVWIMGMAVGAGILVILPLMAALAVSFALLAMVQGEGMNTETGRQPGDGRMAASAVQAKLVSVNGRLGVAAGTIAGRAGHDGRRVTGLAFLTGMPTI